MRKSIWFLVPCAVFLWSCDLQPKIVGAFGDDHAITSATAASAPMSTAAPATSVSDGTALYGDESATQYGSMSNLYGTAPAEAPIAPVTTVSVIKPSPKDIAATVPQPVVLPHPAPVVTPAPTPVITPAPPPADVAPNLYGVLDDHSPDDVLLVPARVATADRVVQVVPPENGTVAVQAGDTLFAISERYDVPLRDLISENNLTAPYALRAGQKLKLPDARYHVVAVGDTLYSISRAHSVDLNSLAQTNELREPYTLVVGQKLKLPATIGAAQSTAQSTDNAQPTLPPVTTVSIIKPSPKDVASAAPVTPAPMYGAVPPSAEATGGKPPTNVTTPQTAAAGASNAARHPAPNITVTPSVSGGNVDKLPRVTGRASTKFSWPVSGKIVSDFGAKKNGLYNDGINISAPIGTPVRAAENGVVAYAGNELKGMGNLVIIQHTGGWMTVYAHMDTMNVKRGTPVSVGDKIGTVGQTGKVDSPQLHFEIRNGTKAYNPRTQMK
ncbi:MAG: LysM peptidoglycan-binding domain-containing M23 family metallopeptidase [Proteobacteria bacterium]|nr:LysM peptidoglycan-binding domain-containing M23 family metallopeptidase [Pseudomonadota bacterium]